MLKSINLNTYQWLVNQARPHGRFVILIILLSVISALTSVASAIISKYVIDLAVEHKLQHAIGYALLFAILLFAKIGFNALITVKTSKIREKMTYRMQSEFIDHLYYVEWLELNKYHSGDILTRLTSDVANIVNVWVVVIPNILALSFQLITAFFTLLFYDRTLAIFAFMLGPVAIIVSWIIGRKIKQMQHQIQSAESKYRSYLHESIQNILIIKSFGYESGSLQRIRSYQKVKSHWVMKRSKFGASANLVLSFSYRLGYFLAFSWGAYRVSMGSASFGTFTAFLQLVGQIQSPFEGLSSSLPQIILATSSAERMMDFNTLEVEAKNRDSCVYLNQPLGLVVDKVSFAYEENKLILDKASFHVKPGETVALIGLSGEGKTTIIRILLAFLNPNGGNVFLEGTGFGRIQITADTRPAFSYVPQGNTLFSGTIAENLYLASPEASLEDLENVLKCACAWEFIQSLPNGIHTVIGERGLGLSEGQAQRISIARALLRKSPILLLDEATSALDQDTECTVLGNIRNLLPIRTCIAITHRSSVFDVCDHVYLLRDGLVYEEKALTPHV